jgi:mannose-6-phosphate isomerase
VKPEPFRIEPTFVPRIWGARSLAPLYPEKSNLPEPIGEAWLTGVNCKVVSGPFEGKTLGEAWREMPPEWRGTRFTEPGDFPLLVKFIFPNDKLSIQVHPNDAYAASHEKAAGGRGKTEMWHAVYAEPQASVLIGLDPKVDEKKFIQAIEKHTLEDLFFHWRVQPGDTFFVPAGTPHTIGPGMVLCEIQEYSDLTYRVYDYERVDAKGRPRELHIQKALEVIQFGRPVGAKTHRIRLGARGSDVSLIAACRYFATELWKVSAATEVSTNAEHADLFVVLTRDGTFTWGTGSAKFQSGECWLIPAGLNKLTVDSGSASKMLKTYVPDITALTGCLRDKGLGFQEIEKTVFE